MEGARADRFAWLAAALCAVAASAGTAVPALKLLGGPGRLGPAAASAFVAAHVLGGIVAAFAARGHRRGGAAPMGLALAFAASLLLNFAMALAVERLAWLIALRLVDGAAHVTLVSGLMGLGGSGDGEQRARRMAILGALLVVGVGAGIAAGGFVAGGGPARCFLLSAALVAFAAGAAATAGAGAHLREKTSARSPEAPPDAPSSRARPRVDLVPGLLVAAERFAMGCLAVWLPLALGSPRESGATLGLLMLSSVVATPVGRRFARRFGPRRCWQAGAFSLPVALALLAAAPGWLASGARYAWAVGAGLAAGAMFVGALLAVAEQADLPRRVRALGLVHALGGVGFFFGSLLVGGLLARAGGRPAASVVEVPLAAALVLAVVAMAGTLATRRGMVPLRSDERPQPLAPDSHGT